MNITVVLLICGLNVLTSFLFLICGYKLGRSRQIITIEKGDKVAEVNTKKYEDYPDEEASFVTPEMEQVYEAYVRKKGGIDGMET